MRVLATVLVAFWVFVAAAKAAGTTDFGPLWAYHGSWKVTKEGGAASAPDNLVNACAQVGNYLACQQTVNGTVSALLIFLSTGEPNRFHTQSVRPDGRAGGIGDLEINGDKWTFSSRWNQGGGRTTYYRTINTFSGKSAIRYEQQESTDNKEWKTTGSGQETRTASGRMTVVK